MSIGETTTPMKIIGLTFLRKHPILTIFSLLIIGGIVAGVVRARRPKPLLVRAAKVERIDELVSIVSASGEIRAHEMVDIQTEVPGVIVDLPVKEGQGVKKGEVLLRIDPFQSQTDLAGARAKSAASESDVKRFESMIASAEANRERQRNQVQATQAAEEEATIRLERDRKALERYKELRANKSISADQFEDFESKMRISEMQVRTAKANIDQSRAQLRVAEMAVQEQKTARESARQNNVATASTFNKVEDQLKKTTIHSPLDGVIVKNNVEVGERAVPGIQSNPQATLMTIANLALIEAEIQVDETDIVRVSLDDQVTIKVDALPDDELHGRVSEIGAAPVQMLSSSTTSQSREGKDFKVVVVIDNPPDTLRMGMSCEAEITVETREEVLAIPIQSLTMREVDVDAAGNYIPPPKPVNGRTISPPTNAIPAPAAADPATTPAAVRADDATTTSTSKILKKKEKDKRKELQGVFVLGGDGRAHYRPVKTGIMGEMTVELLDGLKEGELVLTGPLDSLRQLEEWSLVKQENDTAKQ